MLKIAGLCLGYKHSAKTIAKFKAIAGLRDGHVTVIINKKDKSMKNYDCICNTAKSLSISYDILIHYIKSGKLYKNTYLIIRLIKIR